MENPYSSPKADSAEPAPRAAMPGLRRASWAVGQVRLVAILLLIQGILEALFGLVFIGMAVFLLIVMNQTNLNATPGAEPLHVVMLYFILAASLLFPGGFHIWAGISNLAFRNYMVGLIALGTTAIVMVSCICAPTGFALMIYGLIVYLQPEVVEAFQLGETGQNVDVILHAYK